MEPTQKKNFLLLMIVFIIAALIIMYVFSLRSQLQEVRANQGNYEEQIQSLSSIQNTDALKVNRQFLESFFTYQTTAERYKKVEPFMTDQGLKANIRPLKRKLNFLMNLNSLRNLTMWLQPTRLSLKLRSFL